MKPKRIRLPDRRRTITVTVLIGKDMATNRPRWKIADGVNPEDDRDHPWTVHTKWDVSLGFDGACRVKETFVYGTRGDQKGFTDDSCVMMSKLLQYGEGLADISKSLGGTDDEPASVLRIVAHVAGIIDRDMAPVSPEKRAIGGGE